MKILSIKDQNVVPGAIFEASLVLQEGGVVVFPTDTLYALGADARQEETIRKVFKIKHRPLSRPIPLFVKDIEMLKRYAWVDYGKDKILDRIWPGAVTVVLFKKDILPSLLTSGGNTVGVRIPDHEVPRLLVKSLGGPITATSANLSGNSPSRKIKDVIGEFQLASSKPDLVLDAGDLPESKPSTVLDLTHDEPKVLRMGSVTKQQLEGFFNSSHT